MTVSAFAIGVLWLALALPAGGIAWIIFTMFWEMFAGRRPGDFTDVKDDLDLLLQRGFHNGTLTISHRKSGQSMRFIKIFGVKGEHLVATTVGQGWTPEHNEKLRAYCAANGLDITPVESSTDGEPADRQVDCGRDTDLAQALAHAIWTDFFGLPAHAHRKVVADGISESDEPFDDPDHPPLSEAEAKERLYEKYAARMALLKRRRHQQGFVNVGFIAVVTLVHATALIGLPVATLMSIGAPPDWTVPLGAVHAAGSTASAVFLMILLITLPAGTFVKTVYRPRDRKSWSTVHEQIFEFVAPAIVRALPAAVILIWLGA